MRGVDQAGQQTGEEHEALRVHAQGVLEPGKALKRDPSWKSEVIQQHDDEEVAPQAVELSDPTHLLPRSLKKRFGALGF